MKELKYKDISEKIIGAAFEVEVGLLINFGRKSLTFKRLVL